MNNEYYYVYGTYGEDLLSFKILEKEINDSDILKLNQKNYYTNYEDIRISNKDDFNIILLCKEEEIDKVKNRRKHYKESKKEKEEQDRLRSLKAGAIINNIHYKKKRYIILENHKKTLECLDIDKIKKGVYSPILIKKDDAIISKDTSLNGIKWFEINPNFNLEKINNKLEEIFSIQKKFLNNEVIIEEKKEEVVINNNQNIMNVQRGNIVRIDDKLYYIYGEEGQDWLTFEVTSEFNEEYDELVINNFKYYTVYNDVSFNKKQNFNIISLGSEKEIDNIKLMRKSYKKTNKVKIQKHQNNIQIVVQPRIRVGSIIRKKESSEEYIVKQIIGKTLCCISVFEQSLADKKTCYFNINEVELINKTKRK